MSFLHLQVVGKPDARKEKAFHSCRTRSWPYAGIVLYASLTPVIIVALASRAHSVQPSAQRASVLFIAIDDLNDWVGFLRGHPRIKTPNMDRLAARGVVFSNAHCAAPLCCPSRAAVFSGRQPFHTGVYDNDHQIRRLQPNLMLMPQHFKAHGYRTLGTGKLLHRRHPQLFDESFFPEQRWSPFTRQQVEYAAEELPSKGTANPRHVIRLSPQSQIVLPLNRMPSDRRPETASGESFDWGPIEIDDMQMGDAQVARWAADKLRQDDGRLFLAAGFYRPHIPLFAPAKYFQAYPVDSVQLPKILEDDLADLPQIARRVALEPVTAGSHGTVLKYKQWNAAVAAYLACVSFVDAQVGVLLEALDQSPYARNTVVVLWSDHGWHLGEKQHWGKWTGWERSTRVPLVIVPPKSGKRPYAINSVCQQPVSLLDLYPTLIELCGLDPLEDLDGESLVPLLVEPGKSTRRTVLATFGRGNYVVRDFRWGYIRYADGSEELYDQANDMHQWHNLATSDEHAGVKFRLARQLPSPN